VIAGPSGPRLESNKSFRAAPSGAWVLPLSWLITDGRACQHGKSNSAGLYAIESTTKVLVSPSVGCRDHTRRLPLHIHAQDALCVVYHTAQHCVCVCVCVCGKNRHHCSILSVSPSDTKIEHGKQFDIYMHCLQNKTDLTPYYLHEVLLDAWKYRTQRSTKHVMTSRSITVAGRTPDIHQ
jgi:hypothetical protein